MVRKKIGHPRRRKTDDCDTPILPATPAEEYRTTPEDACAEAEDRLVTRRQLVIEAGDVFITKVSGFRSAGGHDRYRLARNGDGPPLGEYGNYDDAVKAGDMLATTDGVRLFYREGPDVVPQLLKDCRTG